MKLGDAFRLDVDSLAADVDVPVAKVAAIAAALEERDHLVRFLGVADAITRLPSRSVHVRDRAALDRLHAHLGVVDTGERLDTRRLGAAYAAGIHVYLEESLEVDVAEIRDPTDGRVLARFRLS